ncbi:MAG TPA: DsbE family thiol:disulfide interchange protein [Candidatus Saccharimonadia bacterium]|nr:DsbE family thiol:disulfide interchange protein [Candidatus Saccharimonadia bacterium]
MKHLGFVVPLVLFAGLALLLFAGLGKDTRLVPSPLIGKPAPAYDLPALNDPSQRIASSQFAGAPYVLNVWGSWCVECRNEHGTLTRFAERNLVPVIGLNWKDDGDDAKRWLAQFGDPYDAIPVDADGRVAIDYGVYGAPETFLVDAAGIIRFKHVGPLTPEIVERELVARIDAMGKGR